jgi:hypothetical protein
VTVEGRRCECLWWASVVLAAAAVLFLLSDEPRRVLYHLTDAAWGFR